MSETLILALETSCDETAAALVHNGKKIIAEKVASQIPTHRLYGGVVPEIASREHLEVINPLIAETMDAAGVDYSDLTHIAVTQGPGLVGALLVGVSTAKALAYAAGKPLLGIHHIEGHIYANFLVHDEIELPVVALIISGGHTGLVKMSRHGEYLSLGKTRDDAVGEAYDKVARTLGLPYPGGPALERLALEGDRAAIALPRARLEKDSLDFSFSGLKSAVLNHLNSEKMKGNEINKADVAASFEEAVADVLTEKTLSAAQREKVNTVVLAGGVAANTYLRVKLEEALGEAGIKLYYPPLKYCTDNAVMIGAAAHYKALAGEFADLSLNAKPRLKFSGS